METMRSQIGVVSEGRLHNLIRNSHKERAQGLHGLNIHVEGIWHKIYRWSNVLDDAN